MSAILMSKIIKIRQLFRCRGGHTLQWPVCQNSLASCFVYYVF